MRLVQARLPCRPRSPLLHLLEPCSLAEEKGLICVDVAPGVEGRRFAKGAYCLGKIVYGKGWEELLTLLDFHQRHTHESQADVNHPTIDAYGSGEAFEHVRSTSFRFMASACTVLPQTAHVCIGNLAGAFQNAMQVKGMAEKLGVQINWLGRRDHLDPMLQDYQASCLP